MNWTSVCVCGRVCVCQCVHLVIDLNQLFTQVGMTLATRAKRLYCLAMVSPVMLMLWPSLPLLWTTLPCH